MADVAEDTFTAYPLRGHKDGVLCVATGPVGKKEKNWREERPLLLSGSEDSTVRLWDLKTRKPTRCILGCFSKNPVNSVAFTPGDPNRIYAAAGNKIFSFDLRKTSILLTKPETILEFNKEEISQVAMHRKGKFLASCDDSGEIQVIDFRGREPKKLKTLKGHSNICSTVQFRPQAPWHLVSGSMEAKDAISHWDFNRPKLLTTYSNQFEQERDEQEKKRAKNKGKKLNEPVIPETRIVNPPFVSSLSFSHDGKILAAGLGSGHVGVYNAKACETLGAFKAHALGVSSVEFPTFGNDLKDGLLLTAGSDKSLAMWQGVGGDMGAVKLKVRVGLPEKPNWIATSSFGGAMVAVADCSATIKCCYFRQ